MEINQQRDNHQQFQTLISANEKAPQMRGLSFFIVCAIDDHIMPPMPPAPAAAEFSQNDRTQCCTSTRLRITPS
jgi:hypothetical protein